MSRLGRHTRGIEAIGAFLALMAWCVSATAEATDAPAVELRPLGGAVERHVSPDEPRAEWRRDDSADAQGDRIEVRKVRTQALTTVKLQNVVPPIRFASGRAEIPEDYAARLREVLDGMKDRTTVRLHFVGHTDNVPLSPELAAPHDNHAALSREPHGLVAASLKVALGPTP